MSSYLRDITLEKLGLKAGDVLVVCRGTTGSITLKRRRRNQPASKDRKAYLTPPVLASQALKDVYATSDPGWTRLEREAVEASRRSLAGERIEEL